MVAERSRTLQSDDVIHAPQRWRSGEGVTGTVIRANVHGVPRLTIGWNFLATQVGVDFRLLVDPENSIEDEQLEHPKDCETGEVGGIHDAGVYEMTPLMSVHEVLREGGAQYGEADAQRGHHGKWQDLFTDMTSSSLAPCPPAVQSIRRDGPDDVPDERRLHFASNDLEAVDQRDDDDGDDRRNDRDRREAN